MMRCAITAVYPPTASTSNNPRIGSVHPAASISDADTLQTLVRTQRASSQNTRVYLILHKWDPSFHPL